MENRLGVLGANRNGITLLAAAIGVLLAGGSASAQVVSNVAASNSTSNSMVITWTTDQPTTSQVNYGVTMGYGSSSALSPALVTAHSVTLSGLAANTLYYFDVVSVNSSNSSVTSWSYRSATLSVAPLISNINTIYITSTSATINWTTDQPSTALVNYGPTINYGSSSGLNSNLATSHSITLNGLSPSTTYNFNVVSSGAANIPGSSANQTFTTIATPASVPNLGFVGSYGMTNSSAILSWSTDVPSTTALAYGTTPALGQMTPVQTTMNFSHGLTLTGLNRGTTYYFVAVSTGVNGATGYSPLLSLTTTGPPSFVPTVTNVASSNLTTTSATITWTTDQASTSQVTYGATTSYGSATALDPTLTTNHSVTVTGLTGGTRYNFQVVSASTTGTVVFGANMAGITVWAWGDSLTLGYGDFTANTYPLYLTTDIGTQVVNEAVGGTNSTQIATLMLSTPASFPVGNCNVIWSGGNNHNQVNTVLSDIASMIAALNPLSCYLVLGDINDGYSPVGTADYNSVLSTNNSLAALYPNNYLNIREMLVQAYNPALTLDQAFYANDIPALSLHAVQLHGSITSGALDPVSCAINVSNGFMGPVIVIDSETILVNSTSNNTVTSCVRGYNGTAAASHQANANYSIIDLTHLGSNGYEFVATQVAKWFDAQFPVYFTTPTVYTPSPVISGVTVSNITTTSAVVTWTTDQPATTQVNFGPTTAYGTSSALDPTLTTAHSVTLAGLASNSPYNLDAVSANSVGRTSTSPNYTFSTSAAPAPVISGVSAATVSPTSVAITWTTSQPATAQVNYGTTSSLGTLTPVKATLTTSQSVTLTGLTASTNYNYQVISANSAGIIGTSPNYTFATSSPTGPPPNVSYVAFWGVNNTGVTISWSTDVNANTVVSYGTTPARGQFYINNSAGSTSTTSHGAVLTGLTPGTTYYFVAQSTGSNGATGYSTAYSFTTTGAVPVNPGFTLSATAATAIIGSSGTSTVTVTPTNGFNSGVTLAPSGWPAGITRSFQPNPATTTSSLTINVGSSVAPGAYTLLLVGSSGTLSASTTLMLTVSGPPSFTLAASMAASNVGTPARYIAYGDSNTLGAGASSFSTAYISLIAADLGAALTTRPATGTQACDATQTIMSNDDPSASRAPLQTIMIGTNDAYYKGAGAYEAVYTACHSASLAWLAIPVTQKTLAQSCVQSGNWAPDSTYIPGVAAKSSTNGSSLSCPVNSYGGPIYLWYRVTDLNGGTFTYSVDGGPAQQLNAFSNVPIATTAGGVDGVFLLRIPNVQSGSHNIFITVTSPTSSSNVVSILAVGSLNTLAQYGAPAVFVGGVLREQNDQNYSATAAYDADAAADAVLLSGDGLPVYFVPVRDYVNDTTDMVDGLHINDTGHQHMRTAIESAGPFSAYSTGSVRSIVTVKPINGFTSPVTLTASGWPSGITGTIGTNPTAGSSTIALNIDPSVLPGQYSLPVSGTGGGLSASTAIALTVNATGAPSFAMSATAAAAVAGAMGTSTVTLTTLNGFNSAITLAASTWPTGIIATFGTNPATASSTVTINVGASVAPGSYTLIVTGTSGTLSTSTTIPLTVSAAPSFVMTATTATAPAGGTGTSTVTIVPANGFNSAVTLAATNWSTGITGTFGTNPATASSTASINVAANVASGSYALTVTGTSGTLSTSTTIPLIVSAAPSFAMTATAATAAAGGTGTSTVTIVPANGFNSAVTLAATNWPTGITGTFGTNPATASSTAYVSVAASVASGSYTLNLSGTSGTLTKTTTIALTVTSAASAGSSAVFSQLDTLTEGSWAGTYGSDGYLIANGITSLPGYATLSSNGTSTYTWAALTSDVRALQTAPGSTSRIASSYYAASSFTMNLGLNDGIVHQVAIYLLDWDTTSRSETITITDPVSGNVLDTRNFLGFHNGAYGVWNIKGPVSISVKASVGDPAVSGIFFGAVAPTFTLSSTAVTAVAGATGTSTVAITSLNGFNSAVTLAASGWPAGITGTFGTNPAMASSTVTINVDASVAPGSYALPVTGISSTLSTSTNISLSVNAAPTFTMNATTATAVVGATGTSTLTIVPSNGFNSPVTLAASGWPAGITGTFGTNPAMASSTVTINVDASVAPGSYALPVTGISSTLSTSTNISLSVNAAPTFIMNATTATAVVGATGTSTLTIVPSNGFNSPVTLAASGWPAGITGTFGTNPAMASSTVTINVDASVAPGSYALPVTGISGTLSTSTNISLSVNAAPTFTMGATTATAVVGTTGTSTLTIVPANGFNSAVTLAASNWPAGITGTFGTNPATASSTVTINVGTSVAPGSYALPVTGINGTLSTSTNISLSVNAAPTFTMGATTATAVVGTTGTSTLTIVPANGFNSAVTLAASNWPAGITGTFGTNPATASSTLTINIGASVAPGPYTLSVSGTSGTVSKTATIALTVTPILSSGSSTATFNGLDTTTEGNWTGTYGSDGYLIANGNSSLPGYASLGSTSASTYTWAGLTSDVRALQSSPGSASRIASSFYASGSFTMNVGLNDGNSHQMAIYMLDWDTTTRSQTVTLTDPVSGNVLDSRTISGFHNGAYGLWSIKGPVSLTVTASVANPVVSGIFFGYATPSFAMSATAATASAGSKGTSTIVITPSGGFNGAVTLVASTWPAGITAAFATNPATASSTVTISVGVNIAPGTYTLPVTGISGALSASANIALTVTGPVGTSAVFAGIDTTTQGTWTGKYGSAGYVIADGSNVTPGFATVGFLSAMTYAWVTPTTDVRGLQSSAGSSTRVAAAYTEYAGQSFSINVGIVDGSAHKISLYLLDWDNSGHNQTITIIDGSTGAVLDVEPFSGFQSGIYASWWVSGNVKILVTPIGSTSPSVSGLFFN